MCIRDRYNEVQKSQGMDLAPYAGKTCRQWIYRVKMCIRDSICTLAAAGLAAFLFPLPEEEDSSEAPSAQEPAASEGRERP